VLPCSLKLRPLAHQQTLDARRVEHARQQWRSTWRATATPHRCTSAVPPAPSPTIPASKFLRHMNRTEMYQIPWHDIPGCQLTKADVGDVLGRRSDPYATHCCSRNCPCLRCFAYDAKTGLEQCKYNNATSSHPRSWAQPHRWAIC
jgi:hypothetical protein